MRDAFIEIKYALAENPSYGYIADIYWTGYEVICNGAGTLRSLEYKSLHKKPLAVTVTDGDQTLFTGIINPGYWLFGVKFYTGLRVSLAEV